VVNNKKDVRIHDLRAPIESLPKPLSPGSEEDTTQEIKETKTLTGFLPITSFKPCLVIAESWPSWLLVSAPLQLSCSKWYTNLPQEGWVEEILKIYTHVALTSLSAFSTDLTQVSPSTLILIQGERDFVEGWIKLLPNTFTYLASVTWSSQPPLVGTWQLLTHEECGGVTSGTWGVGTNRELLQLQSQSLRRDLPSILDPTAEHPKRKRMIDIARQQPLTTQLSVSNPRKSVIAPSVYTEKCKRPLSVQELGKAFDLPFDIGEVFVTGRFDLPFLHDAPTSILLHFGRQLLSTPTNLLGRRMLSCPEPPPNIANSSLLPSDQRQEEKATRSDDAEVPVYLWDNKFWDNTKYSKERLTTFTSKMDNATLRRKYGCERVTPLVVLRHFAHIKWIRNVFKDFIQYASANLGTKWLDELKDTLLVKTAVDALHRVSQSTFWEWSEGSTLLFWRWPSAHIDAALEGYPSWVVGDLPNYRVPQRPERSPETRSMVQAKLKTVRHRWYVSPGQLGSLTSYFSVPKGNSDIRLVYDASESGLNKCLWSPSFHLPTVDALIRSMDSESWMGDLDLGEMFHNFPLDIHLRPYCGIDMPPLL
jgi:hypothetical protein